MPQCGSGRAAPVLPMVLCRTCDGVSFVMSRQTTPDTKHNLFVANPELKHTTLFPVEQSRETRDE